MFRAKHFVLYLNIFLVMRILVLNPFLISYRYQISLSALLLFSTKNIYKRFTFSFLQFTPNLQQNIFTINGKNKAKNKTKTLYKVFKCGKDKLQTAVRKCLPKDFELHSHLIVSFLQFVHISMQNLTLKVPSSILPCTHSCT